MSTDPNLLADLEARGLIHDSTDREALRSRLAEGPISLYYGVDPTATSLHVGNLIGLLTLRRFQEAGHRPVPLAGGATGMIGDPSGRSNERNLLDDDALASNLAGIVPLLRQFVDFDTDRANSGKLLDNRAWTVGTPYLTFLRDVGKHITINQMVAKESVKNRMAGEDGISYTEFSYMLLQAHDYYWLHENEGVELQIGGSDQWGNITLGVDLIRRKSGVKVHAMTWPLLLKKDGTKYGKTAGGETIWLTSEHMSPYRFYQAWIQVEDGELPKLLAQLTMLPMDEVGEVVAKHNEVPHLREGQRRLADELTTIVHGEAAAQSAQKASSVIFGGSGAGLDTDTLAMLSSEVPTTVLDRAELDRDDNLLDLLVMTGVTKSKSEGSRLIKQNGISVNDQKISADYVFTRDGLLQDKYYLVRRGKKAIFLLSFEG